MDPSAPHPSTPHASTPHPSALRPSRRRIIAALLLLAVIAAGLAVHAFAPDSAASDIAGDALYAVAAYLAVLIVAPRLRPVTAGLIAAAWCTAVELFQLTGVPSALGASFPPSTLVLGTVFDPRDLAVYLATIAVVTAVDALVAARRSRVTAD